MTTNIPTDSPAFGSTPESHDEVVDRLRTGTALEAWVLDGQGNWPAYLWGMEPANNDRQERLRWVGPGPVSDRVTLRFAQGRSLYECEAEAFSTGELSFETSLPVEISHCRTRSHERLLPPAQTAVVLSSGEERQVVEISRTGLRFGLSVLMDKLHLGDVISLLLRAPGIPALSLRMEVRHLSEVGEDGPLTAGGPIELDHPAAGPVWDRLIRSVSKAETAA
jgi:hypothetical protein